MSKLQGYRTYICAGLLALNTFALAMGFIDQGLHDTLLGLLGSGGLIALRLAIK